MQLLQRKLWSDKRRELFRVYEVRYDAIRAFKGIPCEFRGKGVLERRGQFCLQDHGLLWRFDVQGGEAL